MRGTIFILIGILLPWLSGCQFHGGQVEKEIDVIKPIRLTAGMTDTILISDLFFAEDYSSFTVQDDSAVSTKYLRESRELVLKPTAKTRGIVLLQAEFRDQPFNIPVRVKALIPHTFRYRKRQSFKNLTVFGSFNTWNRNQFPLSDRDGDGIYSTTISLEPGRYEYKFFMDGKELEDPENPDKVKNPWGYYNSVLVIPSPFKKRSVLVPIAFSSSASHYDYSFIFLPGDLGMHASTGNTLALLNNQSIHSRVSVSNDTIRIRLPKTQLHGNQLLRVAVNIREENSWFTPVYLYNGIPTGLSKHPFRWNDAIIYSIMVDRFRDGDPSNNAPVIQDSLFPKANYMGGDLEGIEKTIQEGYFDSLGINTLWISPVVANPHQAFREYPAPHRYFAGYHGYWPVHSRQVDSHFGTLQDFKRVVNLLHKKNKKILLDFVANHTHIDHPYFKKHPDWYGTLDLPNGRKNLRLWDEYRLTTWFDRFLPSFDYVNSATARDTMTDNALWWVQQTKIDGFRHDAVKHVPFVFWRELTSKLRQKHAGQLYQIGETFGSYSLISSYVNPGQLDGQFNFNLYDAALYTFLTPNAGMDILSREVEKTLDVYGVDNLMGNLMDSHDKVRYLAYADGDITLTGGNAQEIGWMNPPVVEHPSSYEKELVYLTYMLTVPGIPIIYYGDEVGMTGASDPDNRRMMRFGEQVSTREKQLFKQVSRLIKLRNKISSLRYGIYQPIVSSGPVWIYVRTDFAGQAMVLLNKSGEKTRAAFEINSHLTGKWKNPFSPKDYYFDVGKNVISLKPFEHTILIKQSESNMKLDGMKED